MPSPGSGDDCPSRTSCSGVVLCTAYEEQRSIACTETVFYRDDLGEDSKVDEARLFKTVLSEGGEIDAARLSSARLPVELSSQVPK
jgi:hypothetical protein